MTINSGNELLPGGGLHHIAVQTLDWEGSVRLYRDILGMRVVSEFGQPGRRKLLLAAGDGGHIELFAPSGTPSPVTTPASEHPLVHLALRSTAVHQVIEHVRRAGYVISVEPKDVQLGSIKATVAFFTGPNGERIELFQTN